MTVNAVVAESQSESPVLPDSEIRKILTERIDGRRQSVGIVVGVVEPQGRRVIAHGHLDHGDPRPLNGETVFEIGSVTKVFTALLLADMAQRGEVALIDPVAKYLPKELSVPERNGRSITLEDLATHTSGLPRMPSNFAPKDPNNPYADYSVEQLYQFLSHYELTRDIGVQFEYSNLGGGLLGHALSRRIGVDYETLVQTRVAGPLGMSSTGITLSPELQNRLAVGHSATSEAVPNWDLPALAGAGALRSTAHDLQTFVEAALGFTESPLARAFQAMLNVRRPSSVPYSEIALGWMIDKDGADVVWHGGGTGGYRSFVGFVPKKRVGVVALSNTATSVSVHDIGRHLLDPRLPLAPPQERKEIAIDPKLFDGYVGRYQWGPNINLTVTREDNRLFVQPTGEPKLEIFAESEKDYFLKVVDAQITFQTDGSGQATGLILHHNGRDTPATRIDERS